MSFKTQLDEDAADVFCNTDEFAEEIFYYPDGDTGDKRTFNAVVVRGPVTVWALDGGEALVADARVAFPNSSDVTKGVTAIVKGKDLADVVLEEGKAKVRVRVVEIPSQDPGMFVVGVVR